MWWVESRTIAINWLQLGTREYFRKTFFKLVVFSGMIIAYTQVQYYGCYGKLGIKYLSEFGDSGYRDLFSLAKEISDSASPRRILHWLDWINLDIRHHRIRININYAYIWGRMTSMTPVTIQTLVSDNHWHQVFIQGGSRGRSTKLTLDGRQVVVTEEEQKYKLNVSSNVYMGGIRTSGSKFVDPRVADKKYTNRWVPSVQEVLNGGGNEGRLPASAGGSSLLTLREISYEQVLLQMALVILVTGMKIFKSTPCSVKHIITTHKIRVLCMTTSIEKKERNDKQTENISSSLKGAQGAHWDSLSDYALTWEIHAPSKWRNLC